MTHQDQSGSAVTPGSSEAMREAARRIQLWLQVLRRMEAQYAQVAMKYGEGLTSLNETNREHAAGLVARLHLAVPRPRILL